MGHACGKQFPASGTPLHARTHTLQAKPSPPLHEPHPHARLLRIPPPHTHAPPPLPPPPPSAPACAATRARSPARHATRHACMRTHNTPCLLARRSVLSSHALPGCARLRTSRGPTRAGCCLTPACPAQRSAGADGTVGRRAGGMSRGTRHCTVRASPSFPLARRAGTYRPPPPTCCGARLARCAPHGVHGHDDACYAAQRG